MKLHKIVLPSGEVISSGAGEPWAIVSVKLRQLVNRGKSFCLGSVCAAEAQVELFAPADGVILPGTELELWQGEEKLGLFTVLQARRVSSGRMVLALTDRGWKLQKELTVWLEGLEGWPYTLSEFAEMAAAACGLELESAQIPNGTLKVDAFTRGIVTGEDLLGWCAELSGCFCHVTAEGKLRFGRYEASPVTLMPTGDCFYYRDTLSAAAAPQEDVGGVQIRDPKTDGLLPSYGQGVNTYILESNPMTANVEQTHLARILEGFPRGWTVGTVQIPDSVPVRAGQLVKVFDGTRTVVLPVMERVLEKGRQTISALGSGIGSIGTVSAQARALAQQISIARQAVDAQTQVDIFNKLTDGGRAQGVFLEDGQLYINASFLSAGILDAAVVKVVNLIAETLCSVLGDSSLEIDGARLTMRSADEQTVQLSNSAPGLPILYMSDRKDGMETNRLELTPHHLRLGGSGAIGTLYLSASGGKAALDLDQGDPKTLAWTWDSGLGKYILTGS